jgi:hypothetical protein
MGSWFKIFVAAAVLVLTSSPLGAQAPVFQSVSWTPQQIQTGSPCLFKVQMATSPTSLRAKWQGHDLTFFPAGHDNAWYGLAGVDVEAKPGTYSLDLEATLADGKVLREKRPVLVSLARYKTETLRVPNRYVEPDAETLRRIAADKEIKATAFAHDDPQPEWVGKFLSPIDSTPSEGFGTRRTFNGKLASIHRGMDYHAKVGTPIMAANSGEVVLARELFYEGNCVIIDHGQQFMSLYLHMSKIAVTEGEKVRRGQEIGLSGATGRATGPHLHMAVRWQGAYLDPALLLALPLPDPQTNESRASTK